MKTSLLFWGFQDLNLVSELAKKTRYSLNIKEFYIQINDSEKTVTLMDLYPEEIIRTKYDLNNLYHWITRSSKKNILIIIDLFVFIFQDNFNENCVSLKKILSLGLKICFIAPKILHPQGVKFLNSVELSSISQATNSYKTNLKTLYEIILNNSFNSYIISIPIPEIVTLNRVEYNLFASKTKHGICFFPKILKQFNVSYISLKLLVAKLTENFSTIINIIENNEQSLTKFPFLTTIHADCSIKNLTVKNNLNKKFNLSISVSLARFFKIKNSAPELNFILWLIYLAICEETVAEEKNGTTPLLADMFFSSQSFEGKC